MQVTIYDWSGQARGKLEEIGYAHNQAFEGQTEDDLWKIVQAIYYANLEIMIRDMDLLKPHTHVQIAVDIIGGRFRQR